MVEPTPKPIKNLPGKISWATSSSQSPIWQPLQDESIRILRLCSKLSHYLMCTLEVVQLPHHRDRGYYHSLSYTWGHPTASEKAIPILINGEPTTVRPNLHAALLSIWSHDSSLAIWADALSINQSDAAEKTAQVALMPKIYTKAKSVKIWLGKLDRLDREPMRRAWELMKAFMVDPDRSLAEIARYVFPDDYDWHSLLTNVLLNLSDNEWFYRVWTTQEIILAPTAEVWYGHLSMKWDVFEQGCKRMIKELGLEARVRNPWIEIEKSRKLVESNNATMTELLLTTYRRRATDSRDKIFALAGLLADGTYNADYSEEQRGAFIRAFEHCTRHDKSLMILELAQGFEVPFEVSEVDEQLPEWAQINKKFDRGQVDHYCSTEQQYEDYHWSDYLDQNPWTEKPLSWLPDFDNMQRLSQRIISSNRTRLIPRHTDPVVIKTARRESIGLAGFVLGGLYSCCGWLRPSDATGNLCWKLIPLTFYKGNSRFPKRWFMELRHTFNKDFWPPPRQCDNADVLEDLKAWWPGPANTQHPEPFHERFEKRFEGSKHIKSDVMMPTDAYDGDWICILPGADKLCVLRPVVRQIVNRISLGNYLCSSTQKAGIRLEKFKFIGMIQSEICDELTIDWMDLPVVWATFYLT